MTNKSDGKIRWKGIGGRNRPKNKKPLPLMSMNHTICMQCYIVGTPEEVSTHTCKVKRDKNK